MFRNVFPNMVPFMIEFGKILYTRTATDDNTAHALCMLDNLAYRYTQNIEGNS